MWARNKKKKPGLVGKAMPGQEGNDVILKHNIRH